jgi:predicted alpha/beta-hydrolase family hydrolase
VVNPANPFSPLTITVDETVAVSALWQSPAEARAGFVFAHGAGAGMSHAFMTSVADGLFERGIASLRYQFPYMERGSKRPDAPPLAQATVRAAVDEANRRLPQQPLFAGGKSFGGRMTSQAHAAAPLARVSGLVFLGFPLHPAGKPSRERAQHLLALQCPMLFLQGTRDALADPPLMNSLIADLGPRATMLSIAQADHAFHVPARTGRKDAEVLQEMLDAISAWIERIGGA